MSFFDFAGFKNDQATGSRASSRLSFPISRTLCLSSSRTMIETPGTPKVKIISLFR
jgi:hypothetical protein